jgi:hypothetical protein
MPINFAGQSFPTAYSAAYGERLAGIAQGGYDAQAAIAAREREGVRQDYAQQRAIQAQDSEAAQRVQAGLAMQQQHANLQAWVHSQEMTQAEQMRLQQDKNAIAWVDSQRGKTLTDREADDFIASRMTHVNIAQQRMQQQENQAKIKQQTALTEHTQVMTKLEDARYKALAGDPDAKIAIHIDPGARTDADQYAKDLGLDPHSPEGRAASEEWAMQNGKAHQMLVQKDGSYKPMKEGVAGAKAAGAGGTKGLGEKDYLTHYETAVKLAHQWAKTQETPPSDEAIQAQVQKHMDALEGQRQKFQSGTPEGQRAAQMEKHKETLGKIDTSLSALAQNPQIGPAGKQMGSQLLTQIKELMTRHPPGTRTRAMEDRIRGLQQKYDSYFSEPAPDQTKTQVTPEMIQTSGGGYELNPRLKGLLERMVPPTGSGGGGY